MTNEIKFEFQFEFPAPQIHVDRFLLQLLQAISIFQKIRYGHLNSFRVIWFKIWIVSEEVFWSRPTIAKNRHEVFWSGLVWHEYRRSIGALSRLYKEKLKYFGNKWRVQGSRFNEKWESSRDEKNYWNPSPSLNLPFHTNDKQQKAQKYNNKCQHIAKHHLFFPIEPP